MNYIEYIPLACDVAMIVFMIAVVLGMAKRGFIKSVYKIISVVITILAVSFLTQPVADVLEESQAGAMIYRSVNQTFEKATQEKLTAENSGEADEFTLQAVWDMPSYIKNSSEIRSIKEDMTANASHVVTAMILRLLSAICLFILVRFIVMLLFSLIDVIFKLPVLSGINKIIGVFAGIINCLIVVYVICAVISLNIPVFDGARDVIGNTYIVKHFYNYNILMNMFI